MKVSFIYFRGADLAALIREAAVGALKEFMLHPSGKSSCDITVMGQHFEAALRSVKPSVSKKVWCLFKQPV